jgi:twitching motility protein PilT
MTTQVRRRGRRARCRAASDVRPPALKPRRRGADARDVNFDLADLLLDVIARRASDLHLTAGAPPMVRVRGRLTGLEGYPTLSTTDTREIVYSILTSDQRQKFENDWQLDFAYSVPGHARFRVNAFMQRGAIGAAFRLIPAQIVSIEDLGLPAVVHEFTRRPRGFVLVTGPTGSGKSTSLAAMIDAINATREEHIMTVEDPIEFLHSHKKCIVNQRELGADAQSFELALKGALRQDPDVILVGEMRDLETISTALTAAETGHLVFATLHTQSAPQTIDRIIDVFPAHQQDQVRMQLSVALQGVMTQQLLPTADGSARVAACEVLVPTPAVRNLIREGKTHQIPSAMQTGSGVGMQTMDAALATLVRSGTITQRLAESRSSSPEELKRLLGGVGGFGLAA